MRRLKQQFSGNFKLQFHLAPPLFSRRDSHTGELKKSTYGPWVFKVFKILAKGKALRGTIFDIFGYTAERRMERQMVLDFEITMGKVLPQLTPNNHAIACQIAALPQTVRGFGHVKERNLKVAREAEKKLWAMMGGNWLPPLSF